MNSEETKSAKLKAGVSKAKASGSISPGDLNQLYAVIRAGSKQFTVRAGDKVEVELLGGKVGDNIVLGEVLFVKSGDLSIVGTPIVSGAQVRAKIVEQKVGPNRNKKVIIFKKKRRKGYTKKQGHRQSKTCLVVEEIVAAAA